jgi:hypothetical protein
VAAIFEATCLRAAASATVESSLTFALQAGAVADNGSERNTRPDGGPALTMARQALPRRRRRPNAVWPHPNVERPYCGPPLFLAGELS